jgi:hypothetical protein
MPAHVIQIARQRFVCGLFWQSLSRPRELHKEAVELGRRVKFDLMVLRKDYGNAQAGYANTSEGVRPGMLSLGAAVAKTVAAEGAHYDGRHQPVQNWLAAIELPDGHWAYFAVRDENFLPTGDFAGKKEDVIERLSADYALGGWNVVFGSEELRHIGFHNFHARTLEQFLPRGAGGRMKGQGAWALESLNARRQRLVMASAAVVSVAVLASAWVLLDQQRRSDGQRAMQSALENARRATRPVGPPPPHPWPAQAMPVDFARQCQSQFEHMAPGGWSLDSYECTPATVSHSWKRGHSVVSHLLEIVPEAVVTVDGNTARYARSLGAKPSGSDDRLLAAKEILGAMASGIQALGLAPGFVHVPAPPPPPKALGNPTAAPPPGPPDWQTYKFTLKTGGVSPLQIVEALQQPGVRLTKATFNGEDWSIEGVIYAK